MKIRTLIVICLLAITLISGSGCIDSSSEPVQEAGLEEITDNQTNNQEGSFNDSIKTSPAENLSEKSNLFNDSVELVPVENFSDKSNILELEKESSFSEYYNKEKLQFEADVPAYSLPLKVSEIANYDDFIQKIPLANESIDLLYKNGFVVIENPAIENLPGAGNSLVNSTYRDLKVADVPIFITSDSLLHIYHIQFDETLKRVESEEFYDDLWKLDKTLLDASIEDYDSASGREKEAARRNVAYFAVALSLLQPEGNQIKYRFKVPSFVKNDVEAELSLIEAHAGSQISPIFLYEEDYSQYVPRGHYTHSELLKKYFKAMMWHGRMSMLLQPDAITAEDPEREAKIQTIQALLISDHFDRGKDLRDRWDRIYEVTAFYAGYSDDLGPYEYSKALDAVFGNKRHGMSFNNESLEELNAELEGYESPKIYSGTGGLIPAGPDAENKILDSTKGFRFMGQRYTPDSYILRVLHPPALNIMYLLGSERAGEHLVNLNISDSEDYNVRYRALENEFGALDGDEWNKNLYWAQLYALKPLLVSYPDGYPTFMQTEAWEDKQLNAALASWTELRHDTILYAKQEYFMGFLPAEKPVQGYVEPVPEFYARMLALTKMTHYGLAEMNVLDEQSSKDFITLEINLEYLLKISIKELENKELTEEEYEFIRNFDQNIAPMLENVDIKSQTSVLVADVYTSPNGVLEEGTGKLDLMVVAYKQPDGRIVLGAGPVTSYYEFWQPLGERLTDEEWRSMLNNNPPERPEWISSFRG
ncbi:DUF3160 domain-containing protein [Methanosarcina acetivorans]|uniref:DUF3160 domain-containing protein n=1 Tax=Methanosarcina acetivorans TaxID=2214 RepID=UPI000AF9AB93